LGSRAGRNEAVLDARDELIEGGPGERKLRLEAVAPRGVGERVDVGAALDEILLISEPFGRP
jgi:hypothetical protein